MSNPSSDSYRNPLRHTGQDYSFAPRYLRPRNPLSPTNASADIKPKEQQGYYPLGSLWTNSSNGNLWALATITNNLAKWILISGTSGPILNITVPNGVSPIVADGNGTINFTSNDGSVVITGSSASPNNHTINFDVAGVQSWNVINQSNQPANFSVNNGYICQAGGTGNVSIALPTTSALGDMIEIALDGATSWTITQGAGQQIRVAGSQTTLGAGGSVATTGTGDSIRLVCETANTKWISIGYQGNLTVT